VQRVTSKHLEIERVAERLEAKMDGEGLSLRETARLLSLSPSTLSRIRRHEKPDAETLAVLMDWLALSVDDVLVERGSQGAQRARRMAAPHRRPRSGKRDRATAKGRQPRQM
jgi:transcriptional regulator with XRE-family HTH domain